MAICPPELRTGIVGACTPLLARQMTFFIGHLPSTEEVAVFNEMGITTRALHQPSGRARGHAMVTWSQVLAAGERPSPPRRRWQGHRADARPGVLRPIHRLFPRVKQRSCSTNRTGKTGTRKRVLDPMIS